ncbi:MAG TPA: B-box zinc finger protein [Candidatus Acidoferrales bacterium]|nr:B-box zinc finger protein [Candidatus Acidoferrales bacterium]
MAPVERCSNCGAELDTDVFLYCKNCGALNNKRASDQGIVCDTHIDNRAIGFCVVCGHAVCEECAENIGNKILCSDLEHREYLEKWKVLHTFDFEYEAAMLYANLEQRGIETIVFSKVNPDTTEAMVRPTLVEVLVHSQKYESAIEIRKLLGLSDENEENDS